MTHAQRNLMIKEASKLLDIGSTTLFRLLRERQILGTTNNLPRQEHIKEGIFLVEIRQYKVGKMGIKKPYPVTLVTPKGLCFLREFVEKEKEKEEIDHAI